VFLEKRFLGVDIVEKKVFKAPILFFVLKSKHHFIEAIRKRGTVFPKAV